MAPKLNKQSSEFLEKDPVGWAATRTRQIVGALNSGDGELAYQLTTEEIIPRIGQDNTVGLLDRLFRTYIEPELK